MNMPGSVFNPRGEQSSFAFSSNSRMSAPNASLFTERTPLVQPIPVVPMASSVQQTTPTLVQRRTGGAVQQGECSLVQLKVNVTPPGSMGQKRRNIGSAGSNDGSSLASMRPEQSNRKQSSTTGQQLQNQYLMASQFEPLGRERVESPDLPLIHYVKGSAVSYQRQPSTGRTPDGPTLIATLTQSQLLGQSQCSPNNGLSNRILRNSRGSSSGHDGIDSDALLKQPTENSLFPSSSDHLLMIDDSVTASRAQTSETTPSTNVQQSGQLKQQHSASQSPFSGSPNVVPYSAFHFPGIAENGPVKLGGGKNIEYESSDIRRSRLAHAESDVASTVTSNMGSDGDCSLSNSDIVRINGIMKEIGLPEHGMGNRKKMYVNRPPAPSSRFQMQPPAASQQGNRYRPSLPTGIPRLNNPQASVSNNRSYTNPALSALPKQTASNSKIPIASSTNSAAKTSPGQLQSAVEQAVQQQSGSKSPLMPPAAVYLIEAKDAPRVVLLPRQRSLPDAMKLPSLQDSWRQQNTLPQCHEKLSPQSPTEDNQRILAMMAKENKSAPSSTSNPVEPLLRLKLSPEGKLAFSGGYPLSPPSESGTSDRRTRDMDTQSSLSSSDDDFDDDDDINNGNNPIKQIIAQSLLDDKAENDGQIDNELLERSLEANALISISNFLTESASKKSFPGQEASIVLSQNATAASSISTDERMQCTSPLVKNANASTITTTEIACETENGDLDKTSHGTQTSLPRPPAKRRQKLLPSTMQGATAAATSAPPPIDSKTKRPLAPPFQVKRRQRVKMPTRKYRSLDYIPSDADDAASLMSSRAESPRDEELDKEAESLGFNAEAFLSISSMIRRQLMPDNISLSSMSTCSEMSKSDPNLNYDSGSAAYESEYDNYRPGMASDEDYFVPDPISDVDLDMFDDIDVENVTVSDKYSLDMPLAFLPKRITQV